MGKNNTDDDISLGIITVFILVLLLGIVIGVVITYSSTTYNDDEMLNVAEKRLYEFRDNPELFASWLRGQRTITELINGYQMYGSVSRSLLSAELHKICGGRPLTFVPSWDGLSLNNTGMQNCIETCYNVNQVNIT